MVPWSRRVSYASECSFIFLSVCSGQIIMYLLSIPTIGSWWSQWVVMAVHHCYLWPRWWSDTLGGTLHKVMNSVGQLSETGTDPQRLSGWFFGFITAGFNKWRNHLWYITTVLLKILGKKSNPQSYSSLLVLAWKPPDHWGFWNGCNQWFCNSDFFSPKYHYHCFSNSEIL